MSKCQNMTFASIKRRNSLVLKMKKWQTATKLALGLLNAYKLMYLCIFIKNINENKDGKILEGIEWVLCNRRWIPLYIQLV